MKDNFTLQLKRHKIDYWALFNMSKLILIIANSNWAFEILKYKALFCLFSGLIWGVYSSYSRSLSSLSFLLSLCFILSLFFSVFSPSVCLFVSLLSVCLLSSLLSLPLISISLSSCLCLCLFLLSVWRQFTYLSSYLSHIFKWYEMMLRYDIENLCFVNINGQQSSELITAFQGSSKSWVDCFIAYLTRNVGSLYKCTEIQLGGCLRGPAVSATPHLAMSCPSYSLLTLADGSFAKRIPLTFTVFISTHIRKYMPLHIWK